MKKNKIFKDSRPLEMLDYLDEAYVAEVVDNLDLKIIPLKSFSLGGDMPQNVEYQTTYGVVLRVVEGILQTVVRQKIEERTLSIHQRRTILSTHYVRLFVLGRHIAHQRIQNILQREDSLRNTELVAHDSVSQMLLAQLLQRIIHLGLLVKILRLAHQRAQRKPVATEL